MDLPDKIFEFGKDTSVNVTRKGHLQLKIKLSDRPIEDSRIKPGVSLETLNSLKEELGSDKVVISNDEAFYGAALVITFGNPSLSQGENREVN